MQKRFLFFGLLVLTAQVAWAEVDSSTSLKTYYAAANGKSGNELRMALYGIIANHTEVTYKQLGALMQWSDTENADGRTIIDIYSDCPYTCNGEINWSNSSSVGTGMNREHTVPQNWFDKKTPMVCDAFHIYPTDGKSNGNRASYLYGEVEGNGSSSSGKTCKETGRLGTSGWKAGVTSYTYNGQVYTASVSYSDDRVYEPDNEYKGDLARSYFYMATRYAAGEKDMENCYNWSGGAFGSERNGLGAYTAELMLKWHRMDPVSEKELIRNEVIYGNETYNKSAYKQNNRNPFIDYPELAEYIWGDKQDIPVTVTALDSPYSNESPTGLENIQPWQTGVRAQKVLRDGKLYILYDGRKYNVQGQLVK